MDAKQMVLLQYTTFLLARRKSLCGTLDNHSNHSCGNTWSKQQNNTESPSGSRTKPACAISQTNTDSSPLPCIPTMVQSAYLTKKWMQPVVFTDEREQNQPGTQWWACTALLSTSLHVLKAMLVNFLDGCKDVFNWPLISLSLFWDAQKFCPPSPF